MHGDYVEFFEKQKSSIPKEILTRSVALPIPDNAKGSVRTVLALYVHNISENENRAVEDALVRLYNSQNTLQEKTEFLHRFERLCRNQTQHGKLVLTPSLCTAILKVYRPYLMGKYSGVGAEVFAQGDEILGVLPDENGVYTVNKSTRKDVSPMHLQWNGVSWKWHPGTSSFNPHPDRWYDVHEVNIAWGRGDGSIGTSSPTEGNMDLLRRLQSLQ
jgi:hypothetical protein